ncbi:DinB family protein [Flavobacteriaceae bacterium M23B6Z8]
MDQLSAIIKTSLENRNYFASCLDELSLSFLFEIPSGYNNNIIWQIGHVVSVQQQLVYGLSGLPLLVSKDFIKKYGRGSSPERNINSADVEEIKLLLFRTIEQTKTDLENDVFKSFRVYKTLAGTELHNVKDALLFNNFHDKLHMDRIQKLKKAIKS